MSSRFFGRCRMILPFTGSASMRTVMVSLPSNATPMFVHLSFPESGSDTTVLTLQSGIWPFIVKPSPGELLKKTLEWGKSLFLFFAPVFPPELLLPGLLLLLLLNRLLVGFVV